MVKTSELKEKIIEFLSTGEKTQAEISRHFNLSRSRISEILSELEGEKKISKRKISERTIEISLNRTENLIVGILPSSEYVYLIEALEREGIRYLIRVFNNSLEGFKELILGHIDILASPLVSGYIFYLSDGRIKPLMGISKGGGGVIKRNPKGYLGTTPFSKMDRISKSEKNYEILYFKSVEDLIKSLGEGKVDAISIWEPFLTMEGGVSVDKSELCCALFTTTVTDILEKLKKTYCQIVKSGQIPKAGIEKLSNILKVDENIIEKSLNSYEFTCEIKTEDLQKQLSAMGIGIIKDIGDFIGK